MFKNFDALEILINELMNNENLSNKILLNTYNNFKNSKNLIEKNFDRVINNY